MINKIKAYCINLERAVERHKKSEQEYQRLGVPFEFIKAVDGNKLTNQDISKLGYDELAAKNLRNIYGKRGLDHREIACALSHLKVYQKIKEEKTPIALIAEDDAEFIFDKDYLGELLKELPENWEICSLFHSGSCKRIGHYICRFDSLPGSSVCYLLTLKGAEKLLELSQPLRLAADALIGRAIYKGVLKGFGAFPVKVKHNDNSFSSLLDRGYKKNRLKGVYDFFANRFVWIRHISYFINHNENNYFSDLY